MPSLMEMTEVPMINILEKCDYKSVLTLRKVCHSLRNFIDDSCFKMGLDNVVITIRPTGFSVTCQKSKARWTDSDGFAQDWTPNDLKILLKMAQYSILSCFTVNASTNNAEGLDDLEHILKNQTRPLQTESFKMEGSEVMKVLPHLDSKTLTQIDIRTGNNRTANQNLDGFEQFLELEQFRNVVMLDIENSFLVHAELRKFFHFPSVSVILHETSLEELVALKEAFVTSPHMLYFCLYSRGLGEDQLEQVFGTPFHDPHGGWQQWFFKIQNCKESVLRIELGSALQFWKLKAKEVPQDAVVQH
ncbi:unnamed protein product [Caenorhabditis brenneri]